jgi:hypothetical protein
MRQSGKFAAISLVLLTALAGACFAAGTGGVEAFEKLKSLAGHWEEPNSAMKATLDISLTSGGTAVMERFHMEMDGKPVEMITMYYLDGDQVKLTHYCEAGNQPTMAGTYDPATKTLTFNMVGITNLKSPDDGHMHHAVYNFLDDDHLRMRWTFRKDQKDSGTEDTTFVRVK